MLPKKTLYTFKKTCWFTVNGRKKLFHANGNHQRTGEAIAILVKIDSKSKLYKDTQEVSVKYTGNNPSILFGNGKDICTQHGTSQIYYVNSKR